MSRINIKVIPKSGRSELKVVGKTLKVWLKATPEDGKANNELVRVLADFFGVQRSSINIISGLSSRNKIVDILGMNTGEIEKTLSS
jgi:hypothetical protein